MQEGVLIYNQKPTWMFIRIHAKSHDYQRIPLKLFNSRLNRQIRRMTDALGFKVIKLKRIRIMNLELGI